MICPDDGATDRWAKYVTTSRDWANVGKNEFHMDDDDLVAENARETIMAKTVETWMTELQLQQQFYVRGPIAIGFRPATAQQRGRRPRRMTFYIDLDRAQHQAPRLDGATGDQGALTRAR
jgi:hypothetical protein